MDFNFKSEGDDDNMVLASKRRNIKSMGLEVDSSEIQVYSILSDKSIFHAKFPANLASVAEIKNFINEAVKSISNFPFFQRFSIFVELDEQPICSFSFQHKENIGKDLDFRLCFNRKSTSDLSLSSILELWRKYLDEATKWLLSNTEGCKLFCKLLQAHFNKIMGKGRWRFPFVPLEVKSTDESKLETTFAYDIKWKSLLNISWFINSRDLDDLMGKIDDTLKISKQLLNSNIIRRLKKGQDMLDIAIVITHTGNCYIRGRWNRSKKVGWDKAMWLTFTEQSCVRCLDLRRDLSAGITQIITNLANSLAKEEMRHEQ